MAELEAELRAAHPALLSERLKLLPEVWDGGTAGAGLSFALAGSSARTGSWEPNSERLEQRMGRTLQHGTVSVPGHSWVPMADCWRDAKRRNVAQSALYNHSCVVSNLIVVSGRAGHSHTPA